MRILLAVPVHTGCHIMWQLGVTGHVKWQLGCRPAPTPAVYCAVVFSMLMTSTTRSAESGGGV